MNFLEEELEVGHVGVGGHVGWDVGFWVRGTGFCVLGSGRYYHSSEISINSNLQVPSPSTQPHLAAPPSIVKQIPFTNDASSDAR